MVLAIWFSEEPISFDLSQSEFIVGAIEFLFSAAAIWIGSGLLKRRLSALRVGVVAAWSYILFIVGASLVGFVAGWFALSSIDTTTPELAQQVQKSFQISISYSVRTTILAVSEAALILWALKQFSSDTVREEFVGT